MISLHTKAFKITSIENQRPKVGVDCLKERPSGTLQRKMFLGDTGIPLVSINTILRNATINNKFAQLEHKYSLHLEDSPFPCFRKFRWQKSLPLPS